MAGTKNFVRRFRIAALAVLATVALGGPAAAQDEAGFQSYLPTLRA
ncbi:lytic murein transglycosylase, partial [Sphingomonas sp. HMWF008]